MSSKPLPPELQERLDIYLALREKQLSLDEIRFVLLETRSESYGTPRRLL